MVLRLACQAEADETSVTDLARALQAKGQKSVCLAGDLVNNRMCGVPAGAEPKPK
jgi:phosphohistidine phosphatase SixA